LPRIAALGDVHANLPALEAVLNHAGAQGIDIVWNVGDFLGYGAFPDQVVRRLRKVRALSIVGNYDLKVLKFKRKRHKWQGKKHPLKFYAFQWAYENLSKKSRKYLRKLPREMRLEVEGQQILLTHGSPVSNNEPLGPHTPEARLSELTKIAQVDVVLCGHSHQPFARRVNEVWFINTGSVGRPDDGDPRTSYAVLDLHRGGLQVQHFRLEYDIQRAVKEIRNSGLPEAFAQMTLRGLSLDAVLSAEHAKW
jgi:putative phosphoesterase